LKQKVQLLAQASQGGGSAVGCRRSLGDRLGEERFQACDQGVKGIQSSAQFFGLALAQAFEFALLALLFRFFQVGSGIAQRRGGFGKAAVNFLQRGQPGVQTP
jgi:hypothetical protein